MGVQPDMSIKAVEEKVESIRAMYQDSIDNLSEQY
jgi:uncharacterized protein YeeX (DUF496 family)